MINQSETAAEPPLGSSVDRDRRSGNRGKSHWLRKAAAYGLAIAILVFLARGISFGDFAHAVKNADLFWFLVACAASFAVWFFGETYLYAKLFSYFHSPISFREMLPVNAAQYFLQVINQVAGGAALVLFMKRRKGVALFSGGATMIFLGLIDFLVMALMGVAAAFLVPASLLGKGWYYPVGGAVGVCLVAFFWLRGRPSSRPARWVYDRPSLLSFRDARISHYIKLMLIRTPIFAAQGFILYFQLRAFGIHAPMTQVLAFEPAELFLSAVPITPGGLGVLQAVLILGFHAYGSRAALLAAGIAISTMGVVFRLPLGLGAAGTLARETLHTRPRTLATAE